MNGWFAAAALAATAASFAHPMLGRPHAARLLAADGLPVFTRWLAYLCWHGVTLVFVVMAATLWAVAVDAWPVAAALPIAVSAAGIAALSIVVAIRAGLPPFRLPASYVIGAVAVFTIAGLVRG